VWHGIGLGGSVSHAGHTGKKRAKRQTHLRRHGRLGHGGDGAGLGEAEQRGGATLASSPRRLGARRRQQAALEVFSPPCGAPGWLLDGGATTAAKNSGSGARVLAGLGAGARWRIGFRLARPGGGGGLKLAGARSWHAGHAWV
jgi:hypothetical protein